MNQAAVTLPVAFLRKTIQVAFSRARSFFPSYWSRSPGLTSIQSLLERVPLPGSMADPCPGNLSWMWPLPDQAAGYPPVSCELQPASGMCNSAHLPAVSCRSRELWCRYPDSPSNTPPRQETESPPNYCFIKDDPTSCSRIRNFQHTGYGVKIATRATTEFRVSLRASGLSGGLSSSYNSTMSW